MAPLLPFFSLNQGTSIRIVLAFFFSISTMSAATEEPAWPPTIVQSFSKPSAMPALVWIEELEKARDCAEKRHDFSLFQSATQEISATIAGKYGISGRAATEQERSRIFSSILRTRDHFSGMPDIVNQLYFSHDRQGCWAKLRAEEGYSQHIGVVLAVDAILFGVHNKEEFSELFEENVLEKTASPELMASIITTVLDIHSDDVEEPLRNVMGHLRPEGLEQVVEVVGSHIALLPPRFTLSQIFTELCVCGDDGYKGWTISKMGYLVNWFREGPEDLKKVKQFLFEVFRQDPVRPMTHILSPLSNRAVLVDEKIGKKILDSDYHLEEDSDLLLVPYCCFLPLMNEVLAQEPIVFYMTRKIPSKELGYSFIINKDFSLEDLDKSLEERITAWRSYVEASPNKIDLDGRSPPFSCSYEASRIWEQSLRATICSGLIPSLNDYGVSLRTDGFIDEGLQYMKLGADRGEIMALRNYASGVRELGIKDLYVKMTAVLGDKRFQFEYAKKCSMGHDRIEALKKGRAYFKYAADNGVLRKSLIEVLGEIVPPEYLTPNVLFSARHNFLSGQASHIIETYWSACQLITSRLFAPFYEKQDPEIGILQAQYEYAQMCYLGEGGPVDFVEARKYYKTAADNGITQARICYDLMVERGEGA